MLDAKLVAWRKSLWVRSIDTIQPCTFSYGTTKI